MKNLDNFLKQIDEAMEYNTTGGAIDGMTKNKAKNTIYKATKKCTHNKLYKDSYWKGPQCVWDAFDSLELSWHITKSEYQHDKSMSDSMPVRKVWEFEIFFSNNKGKTIKLGGNLTAAGAGSIDNPLDKYDLVLILY